MADLPSASNRLSESGSGVAVNVNLMAVFSCTAAGTAAVIRRVTKVQDVVDEFTAGEGIDFLSHHFERNKQQTLFAKIATASAGAPLAMDTSHVTGTSIVTASGTISDDEDIKLSVLTGGTVGTAGIEIEYSRDGGRTTKRARLGTATSFLVPGSGRTYAFAAGTLIAGDYVTEVCASPKWDATGLAACFTALKAQALLPRIVLICGDVDEATDVQTIIDEIEAYETTAGRQSVVICSARDRYPTAYMQGDPADVDFAAADTITRGTGSWVTDGFKVGMSVTITGTVSNNVTLPVVTVSATVLTLADGLALEANVNGATISIVGVESKATWRTALNAISGATPSTEKTSHKVVLCGGRARRKSPLNSWRKRRPFSWPLAIRCMGHDVHVSPAKVDLGALEGWDIFDADGVLEEHDERIDGGLLSMRITCARTFDDLPGVYVALPLTLDSDGQPLSRLPITLVGQLTCRIANQGYTQKLNGDVDYNASNGYIRESEARRIDGAVQTRLERALLQRGPEGARATAVRCTVARDVDLRVVGQTVPYEVELQCKAYIEKLSGTVRVGG